MKFRFEHTFETRAERLFAFHENPDNLTLLLQGWPTFRMIAHCGHIRVGAVTRVQERIGGIWISLAFEHFLYEPPRRFAERQVRGPFRVFEHVHEFEPLGTSTIVRDRLDVRLPLYLGGELAITLWVAPKLKRFFQYRHAELERLVRAGAVDVCVTTGTTPSGFA